MRKRTRLLITAVSIAALSGLAGATWLLTRPEVTSRSDEARREYLEAEADISRFYVADARVHLARALQLDPEFPLALSRFAMMEKDSGRDDRAKSLVAQAMSHLDRVTERERYRIRLAAAAIDGNDAEVEKIVTAFIADFPEDKEALLTCAHRAWNEGDHDKGIAFYERLLEIDPSCADAYNQLGYTAARRGEFAKAEEHFQKYAFIAGEIANPYDSLGELYLNIGRYDDAEKALTKSLEIRPDFHASTLNLALLRRKQGNAAEAERLLVEVMPNLQNIGWLINAELILASMALESNRWDVARSRFEELGKIPFFQRSERHREVTMRALFGVTQALSGDIAGAEKNLADAKAAIDAALAKKAALPADPNAAAKSDGAITEKAKNDLLFLEAVLLRAKGDLDGAIAKFQEIDRLESERKTLPFGADYSQFVSRFRYRIEAAKTYELAGRPGEAAVELAKNLAVDPKDRATLEALSRVQPAAAK